MKGTSTTNPTLPPISSNRGPHLPPLLPSRPLAPYSGRNSSEVGGSAITTSTSSMGPPVTAKPQQAPLRLRPALASETGSKEMPNFKGSFQNNEVSLFIDLMTKCFQVQTFCSLMNLIEVFTQQ